MNLGPPDIVNICIQYWNFNCPTWSILSRLHIYQKNEINQQTQKLHRFLQHHKKLRGISLQNHQNAPLPAFNCSRSWNFFGYFLSCRRNHGIASIILYCTKGFWSWSAALPVDGDVKIISSEEIVPSKHEHEGPPINVDYFFKSVAELFLSNCGRLVDVELFSYIRGR